VTVTVSETTGNAAAPPGPVEGGGAAPGPAEDAGTRDKPSQDKGEGTFARLQGRSQDQLAFVNNLLTTLALAVLAFAGGSALDKATRHELGWRRYLLGSALILLAVSLVIGVGLALNRLQSFRISARTARIRELRGPLKSDRRRHELKNLGDQAFFMEQWSRFDKVSRQAEREHKRKPTSRRAERRLVSVRAFQLFCATRYKRGICIETAAGDNMQIQFVLNDGHRTSSADDAKKELEIKELVRKTSKKEIATQKAKMIAELEGLQHKKCDSAGKIASSPDPGKPGQPAQEEEIKKQENEEKEVRRSALYLLDALRDWSGSADDTTWSLLYGQTLTFLAAAILLLLVPLSYYFS